MSSKLILLLLMSALFSSCEFLNQDDDDDGPKVSLDCEYTAEVVYNIGVDVTTDFDESNVPVRTEVLSSNCDEVYPGDIEQDTVDRIYRSGNSITMEDDGVSDGLTVSGANLSHASPSVNECVLGVYIQANYLEGQLSAGTNELVTKVKAGFDFDYCGSSVAVKSLRASKSFLKNTALKPYLR